MSSGTTEFDDAVERIVGRYVADTFWRLQVTREIMRAAVQAGAHPHAQVDEPDDHLAEFSAWAQLCPIRTDSGTGVVEIAVGTWEDPNDGDTSASRRVITHWKWDQ